MPAETGERQNPDSPNQHSSRRFKHLPQAPSLPDATGSTPQLLMLSKRVFSPLSAEERKNILTPFLPALFRRSWRPLPFPLLLLFVFLSSGRGGGVVFKHAEELIPKSVRHLSELGDRISLLPTMHRERTDSDAKGSLSYSPWDTKVV